MRWRCAARSSWRWRGWGRVARIRWSARSLLRGDDVGRRRLARRVRAGRTRRSSRITAAGDKPRGATLVVNLEPCAHHGKTPPCTDAIRAAGVASRGRRRARSRSRRAGRRRRFCSAPESRRSVGSARRGSGGAERAVSVLAAPQTTGRSSPSSSRHPSMAASPTRPAARTGCREPRRASTSTGCAPGSTRSRVGGTTALDGQSPAHGARPVIAAPAAGPHRVRSARDAQPRRVARADRARSADLGRRARRRRRRRTCPCSKHNGVRVFRPNTLAQAFAQLRLGRDPVVVV